MPLYKKNDMFVHDRNLGNGSNRDRTDRGLGQGKITIALVLLQATMLALMGLPLVYHRRMKIHWQVPLGNV